jgi:cold shock CspA family protein
MRTPLIALASALLLAFIVIQLNVLFFADDQLTVQHHLSLLVLTAAALFINGLFNARLALRDAPKKGRGRDRNQDRRNTKRRNGRDGDAPRSDIDRKDRDRKDRDHKDSDRTAKEKNSRNGDRQRDKNPRGEPRGERRGPKVADGADSEKNQPKPNAERASDGQDRRADPVPQAAPADAERGNVKWFNRTKGYGFIVRESGEEIFVHQRSVVPQTEGQRGALRDGQAVAFVVVEHDKGVQADRVTVVEA